MNKKPKLQAMFFDFDGVIVDSNATKTEAFRTLFENYDQDIVTEIIDYHRRHGGISRVEKIRYAHQHIIKHHFSDEELEDWAAAYSELVMEKVIAIEWIDGAKEFLDKKQDSLPMFVISGTPEDELQYIIQRRKMSGYFQKILGSPIKKPDHVRNILLEYRFNPECCIFIGDALTDLHAADETGLHFIGVQGEVDFPVGTKVLPDCRGLESAIKEHFTVNVHQHPICARSDRSA
jgi:HAD superfamily hydrolase (TIGR01549 family)